MREVGNVNMSEFRHEKERKIVKRRRPRRRSYTCNYCRYESTRQYNVTRHEERIHTIKKRPRTCCDLLLPTKGEYYLHCEQYHPEKRLNAIVSRTKYKILADMIRIKNSTAHSDIEIRRRRRRRRRIIFDDDDEEEEESKERNTTEENRTFVSCHRRYSERTRQKNMETRSKSELTFQYSITYSELDRENIPLACFLNDRVNPSTEAAICKDEERSSKKHDDPNESISDKTTVLTDKENTTTIESSRRWTSLSESSSSSSFVGELPTKKLILRRFMTTMNIEVEKTMQKIPLQERNLNVDNTNSITCYKHSFVSSSSSSSFSVMDKENIPNLEKKVTVQLDNSISLPFVTKLHREFLSSVDFDNL